jgi:hypothetical protein
MIGTLLKGIIGFFSNGIGQTVGKGVEKLAIIAALTPLALWLYKSGDEVAIIFAFTYKQLALYGAIAFFIIKVLYYTRAGTARDRNDYRAD